jgi:lipoate-protein ligase A
MAHEWRLVRSGAAYPAWNMAVDEALYRMMKAKATRPTLRLFRWDPPAVSIGRYQDAASDEVRALSQRGFALVRRPTGGLTVLHNGDVSYSMVGAPGEQGVARAPRGLYRQAHESLKEALDSLGMYADLYAGQEQRTLSGLCNAVPTRSDLIVGGVGKIAGSAQARGEGAVLQHGCVHLPGGLDPDSFEHAVPPAFERVLDLRLIEDELTTAETALAWELVERKYSRDEWNLAGRDPMEGSRTWDRGTGKSRDTDAFGGPSYPVKEFEQ